MIQSFYTWSRINQKMDQVKAMKTLKDVLGDETLRVNGKNNVNMVDVSELIFANT